MQTNTTYTIETVTEKLESRNIKCYRASIGGGGAANAFIMQDLEHFMDFLKEQNINCVFIDAKYYDKSDLFITPEQFTPDELEDAYDTLNDQGYSFTQEKATMLLSKVCFSYNSLLNGVDLSYPRAIMVSAAWSGTKVCCILENELTLDGVPVVTAENMLGILINELERFVQSNKPRPLRKYIMYLDDIADDFLRDPLFGTCNTVDSRREYVDLYIRKYQVEDFIQNYWLEEEGSVAETAYEFADYCYILYMIRKAMHLC